MGRAVRRGFKNMWIKPYLTAAAINLKRLAAALFAILSAIWTARTARTATHELLQILHVHTVKNALTAAAAP